MKHLQKILYSLPFLVGFLSCTVDKTDDQYLEKPGTTVQVMLNLSIPNSELPPATRAIHTDESAIHSLYVLEFENGILKGKSDITDKFNNAKGKRIYISIEETEKDIILAVVANSNITNIEKGTEKTAALKQLTYTNANGLSVIPMYGESKVFEGISKDNSYDISMDLIRATAKIEVQYSSTQTEKEFTFLGIKVLNTNTNGYVSNIGIPSGQNITESISANPVNTGEMKTASVYVPETINNSSNKISVLIHGRYKGDDCWYRLDMIKDEKNSLVDKLERNYRYVFALQNINFPGRSEQDALKGEADNKAIEARLMTLSAAEADILDITTDDYYFLGVNSAILQLTDNGEICFVKLKILTNNTSEGWVIVDAPEGVTFNPGRTGGTAATEDLRAVSSVWIYIDTKVVKEDFNFYITTKKIRKTIKIIMPDKQHKNTDYGNT